MSKDNKQLLHADSKTETDQKTQTHTDISKNWRRCSEQGHLPINDICNWLSLVRDVKPTGIIALITPFLAGHHPSDAVDPFECFGRALASHNYKIRHVPYTNLDGIVSTHAYFIRRAAAVVFVASMANCEPQVKELAAEKPLMVLARNTPVLQGYSEPTLESTFRIVSLKE